MSERPAPVALAPGVTVGPGHRLVFIAGPCVIESAEHALRMATLLKAIKAELGVPLLFKASFDKANRSSLASYRGPGLTEGLAALAEVKRVTGLPVITDVHEPAQAEAASEVVDVLQVPAFLCRQTDLLLACGRTGKPVNIKKGQFMAPQDMGNVVEKVRSTGNRAVTLTERGSSFGYNNLVVDLRSFAIMRRFAPVVFDVTHSLQLPGGPGSATGGAKGFHLELARGAVAAGVDALFAEVHDDPPKALSDAPTQLSPDEFRTLVVQTLAVRAALDAVAKK
ncbi:MAG: 3-deoxy-8-phosphooctulonate synthase [Acidobacteria bacterium RBG_13_68_16]|nr:MAG: 3-deoxy-8-phosphooctulonate synthase [Acidobacteria bacterium RBG_13_68_16]